MKESVHLCDLFLYLWNRNINDLLQSFRFPGTYCVYQIQQQKHRLCMLLNHAVTAMDSLHGFALHSTKDFSCLLQRCLHSRIPLVCQINAFCVCEQSDSPCPLQMCTQSGQRQCLSDLILCEVMVSQIQEKSENGKLVRIVTKRELT